MKTLNTLALLAIACFLGILCVRTFLPDPVRAEPGEVVKVDIVRIGGNPYAWLHLIQLITNK